MESALGSHLAVVIIFFAIYIVDSGSQTFFSTDKKLLTWVDVLALLFCSRGGTFYKDM